MTNILKFIGVTTRRSAWYLFIGGLIVSIFFVFDYWHYRPQYELQDSPYKSLIVFQFTIAVSIAFLLSALGAWLLFSANGKNLISKLTSEIIPQNNIKRFFKVFFACYAIAGASLIVVIVVGLFALGSSFVETLISDYSLFYLLVIMLASYPIVSKKLK